MERKPQKNDSLPGSLDMLILRTRSWIRNSPVHSTIVRQRTPRRGSSLYPALQRLELNGWIKGVWVVTPNNRRARISKITATGRKQLALETQKYAKLTLAIARVMGAE